MNILFLSRWFPYPPDNGSKVRIFNLLRILSKNHQVTLLSFNDRPEKPVNADELRLICKKIIVVPWKAYQPNSFKSVLGFFSPIPRSMIDTYSPEMAKQTHHIVTKNPFDIVIASEIEMARYRSLFSLIPAVFDGVEIGVLLEKYTKSNTIQAKLRYGLTWHKHKRYLKQLLKNYPLCTAPSEQEKKSLQANNIRNRNINVIPNFIHLADYQGPTPTKANNLLIFTGSFRYAPNYEAMVWFLGKVFPLIIDKFPEVQLVITGDHLDLPLPTTRNVILTGYLQAIQPKIAEATVSMIPLLTGGGTRLKILEAMALRTAVVSTSKGAEGLDITHGKDILIADTPEAFAQAVSMVLQDHQLRDMLADNAFDLVSEKYSSTAIASQYQALLEQLKPELA